MTSITTFTTPAIPVNKQWFSERTQQKMRRIAGGALLGAMSAVAGATLQTFSNATYTYIFLSDNKLKAPCPAGLIIGYVGNLFNYNPLQTTLFGAIAGGAWGSFTEKA